MEPDVGLNARIAELEQLVEQYERRLEIDCVFVPTLDNAGKYSTIKETVPKKQRPSFSWDGIHCRDQTIKLLEQIIEEKNEIIKNLTETKEKQ